MAEILQTIEYIVMWACFAVFVWTVIDIICWVINEICDFISSNLHAQAKADLKTAEEKYAGKKRHLQALIRRSSK